MYKNSNYYNEIKQKLIDNEIHERVKDYSKERGRVNTYFEVGKLLSEAGKHYGEDVIGKYSEKLMNDVGKKYDKKLLFKMRQLYVLMSDEKVTPLVRQLTWTHCLMLFPIKNIDKINYYIDQILKRNLSKRELEKIIKSKEYERLPEDTKNKLIEHKETNINDFVKEPIIIRNNNYNDISEKALQKLILEDIPHFLKELGSGFTFIDNEYKLKIGDTYNYIDILLFNYKFNCFVVVELKVTKLKKEHIGQIQVYMNYMDENIKEINQSKTIGIIMCTENNELIIKYSSDPRIISRTYEIV